MGHLGVHKCDDLSRRAALGEGMGGGPEIFFSNGAFWYHLGH